MKKEKIFNKHYKIAFWVTLIISIGLMVGGAIVPPPFVIDKSIFTAVGMLFLWAALAFAAKALEDGKIATISKGDTSIQIGRDDDNNGLEDSYEKELQEDEEQG